MVSPHGGCAHIGCCMSPPCKRVVANCRLRCHSTVPETRPKALPAKSCAHHDRGRPARQLVAHHTPRRHMPCQRCPQPHPPVKVKTSSHSPCRRVAGPLPARRPARPAPMRPLPGCTTARCAPCCHWAGACRGTPAPAIDQCARHSDEQDKAVRTSRPSQALQCGCMPRAIKAITLTAKLQTLLLSSTTRQAQHGQMSLINQTEQNKNMAQAIRSGLL